MYTCVHNTYIHTYISVNLEDLISQKTVTVIPPGRIYNILVSNAGGPMSTSEPGDLLSKTNICCLPDIFF